VSRPAAVTVSVLAIVGAGAAWLCAAPAPDAWGASRIASPEVLLSAFDTLWLLLVAIPSARSWSATLTRLVVGLPFHVAVAAAAGAGGGFHAAFGAVALAFAAVGTLAAGGASRVHGTAIALIAFALPLGAYAAGDLCGVAYPHVRPFLLASPAVAPTLLAHAAPTAPASDCTPALLAAGLLLLADLAASRSSQETAA
jgi:hypothetical protein